MKKSVLLISLGIFLFSNFATAAIYNATAGDSVVYECGKIVSNGTYLFNQSFFASTTDSYCLNVTSDNVLVDGLNYQITSNQTIDGVILQGSTLLNSNITLRNIVIFNFSLAIRLVSSGNFIISNTIFNCSSTAISVSDNNLIESNVLIGSSSGAGIALSGSDNNTIQLNNISGFRSSLNPVIYIHDSKNNTINNNTLFDNRMGIKINYHSNLTTLSYNAIFNNSIYGISISDSALNNLAGNDITGNLYNFLISGSSAGFYNNTINSDNYLEGRKLYYNFSISSYSYNSSSAPNASSIYCFSCSNIIVRDLNLSSGNNYYGLYISSPTGLNNIQVINNTFSNFNVGAYVELGVVLTNGGMIINNTFKKNYIGAVVSATVISGGQYSGNVFENNVYPNQLSFSPNPSIFANEFRDNLVPNMLDRTGFYLGRSNRSYPLNQEASIDFSLDQFYSSVPLTNYNYSFTIYPSINFVSSNYSNNVTINFTATKDGIYTIRLNVSDSSRNSDSQIFYVFLGDSHVSDTRYYFHKDEPTHYQPYAESGGDSGVLLPYPPEEHESRNCAFWVQFQIDQLSAPIFLLNSVNVSWWYKSASDSTKAKIQEYSTYSSNGDYEVSLSRHNSIDFGLANFSSLNLANDYLWKSYWYSLKLHGDSVLVTTNSTNLSYADVYSIYAGPEISYLAENSGSDIRDMQLLSSTYDDSTKQDVTMQFEGEGNFTLVLNLTETSQNNFVYYDGIDCSVNPNCTVNSNSGGIINVTFSLGSMHNLSIDGYSSSVDAEPAVERAGSSGGYPIFKLDSADFLEGMEMSLHSQWSVSFPVRETRHTLKLDCISNDSVIVTVHSTPITLTLGLGEEKKVNLDGDSYYDLFLRLNSINYGYADIFMKEINEKIEQSSTIKPEFSEDKDISESGGEDDSSEIQKIKSLQLERWSFEVVLAVLVISITAYYLIRTRQKSW